MTAREAAKRYPAIAVMAFDPGYVPHTSLGRDGDAFVASFTADFYRRFMQDWESRINHYLREGSALRA